VAQRTASRATGGPGATAHGGTKNGDLSFGEWQNINQAVTNPDGSRKATFVGTYLTTGGTGKLRGLKGFGRYTGLVEFAPDGKVTRNEYSAEGEYWVEK
jgi:hypothetical protein